MWYDANCRIKRGQWAEVGAACLHMQKLQRIWQRCTQQNKIVYLYNFCGFYNCFVVWLKKVAF